MARAVIGIQRLALRFLRWAKETIIKSPGLCVAPANSPAIAARMARDDEIFNAENAQGELAR
jgi:hypothetical protein